MFATDYWRLFLETGAPELYLMYSNAKRMEGEYVSDSAGPGPESITLQ